MDNFERYEKELRENIKSHPISPLGTIFTNILITHTHALHKHMSHNMEPWMIFLIFGLSVGCGRTSILISMNEHHPFQSDIICFILDHYINK